MNLKILTLCERNQMKKSTNSVVPFIEISKKNVNSSIVTESRMRGGWGLGVGGEVRDVDRGE